MVTASSTIWKIENAVSILIGLQGADVYPVILDEERGIVLDDICPETGTIGDGEKNLKGKKVRKLLDIIDDEAAKRHS